jgi:hypothetical protein
MEQERFHRNDQQQEHVIRARVRVNYARSLTIDFQLVQFVVGKRPSLDG